VGMEQLQVVFLFWLDLNRSNRRNFKKIKNPNSKINWDLDFLVEERRCEKKQSLSYSVFTIRFVSMICPSTTSA
jgi:hypothetical protein